MISEGKLGGRKTYLLKPMTYMNDSGQSVGAAVRYLKLPLEAVVVMQDEIDLAAAKIKVKTGGGDAGHNGLRSITATLGSDYRRVRIGVGHPGHKGKVYGHVLNNFSKSDEDWLVPLLSAIAEAAPLLAKDDDVGFMNKVALILNPPPKNPKPTEPSSKKNVSRGDAEDAE
jgi:PTH1 family peptidyl-tRNA hydrolase